MTDEQKQYILDNYLSMTNKEIGEAIGCTAGLVQYYANKNGVFRYKNCGNRLNLSEENAQYIKDNYLTMPYKEIANKVGINEKQLSGWIINHVQDRKLKIRQFNDKYFHEIKTPNQAYWLGFIYADGWIVLNEADSNYEFGIELQRKDRYILEELNNALGGKHIIYDRHRDTKICSDTHTSHTDTSVLRVYSKQLVTDLYSHGIDTNKSRSDVFPVVEDSLFLDFLRGYIDGDGCIHKMRPKILGVHITGANELCFKYLRNKLLTDYNISTQIYSEDMEGRQTKYRLYCFRQDDVRRLLDLIYYDKNSTKLDRKYKIYQDFYGLAA